MLHSSNDSGNRFSLKKIKATFDSKGKIKSNNKKGNFLPKLLSVLAALFLWLYVFQAVEYESEIKEVPIVLENFNTNLGLDVVSGFESTIDVTLRGTKSIIDEMSSDNIKATVDLSNVTEIGTYLLDIELEVPGTVKVVEKSINQIKIALDKTTAKQIEITPMINYNIQYPYELGEPILSHDFVTLVGPETDILSVEKACVEMNLGNIKNDIAANAVITLYDSKQYKIDSKYITIEPSIVQVEIPVFKTAKFEIIPDISVDTDKFDITFEPQLVYVKGGVNEIESLGALKTEKRQINFAGDYELRLLLPENTAAHTKYNANDDSLISTVKVRVTEKKSVSEEENILK